MLVHTYTSRLFFFLTFSLSLSPFFLSSNPSAFYLSLYPTLSLRSPVLPPSISLSLFFFFSFPPFSFYPSLIPPLLLPLPRFNPSTFHPSFILSLILLLPPFLSPSLPLIHLLSVPPSFQSFSASGLKL